MHQVFRIHLLMPLIFFSESFSKAPDPIVIDGFTMGTSYHIVYYDAQGRNYKTAIDSILAEINRGISTYDTASDVSKFNQSSMGITTASEHFYKSLAAALSVSELSDGAFDPTVMPLVNAWGFGPGKFLSPSRSQVDSIQEFVGRNKVECANTTIRKKDSRVQLDFGGIGQGYAADVVARFLSSKNIKDILVEIGGEGMAMGINKKRNESWRIGILHPHSTREHQFYAAYVSLKNRSFTTSGNYFNYREIDGRKFGHTIDPDTGFPVQDKLLSASVFADDCTHADAWATAFMVMGFEKSVEKLKSHPELDALFLYSDDDGKVKTFFTEGLKKLIQLEH